MAISQCPKCQLKFTTRSEMQWHLREDHPSPSVPDAPVTITVPRPEPAAPRQGALQRLWGRFRRRGT